MTLEEAFARLPSPEDNSEGRHSLGPIQAGATTLARVVADGLTLNTLVTRKQAQARGGDVRLGCAYVIGDLGWALGLVLGGLWLQGWKVSAVDPGAVAVALRKARWKANGDEGVSVVMDLTLDPRGMADGGAAPADLAHAMTKLLSPVVAELAQATRLGAPAQWRLVADGLVGGLIRQGRAQGRMAEAVELGRAIAADGTTLLRSRQLELVEITCPGRPGVTDWFRLRGGCCRFHTAAGESGEYCTTCVHRDRADQLARMADYLGSVQPQPTS